MWHLTIVCTGMVITTISLAGCLIIPTDYYLYYSRKNVTEEALTGIVIGTTTRTEVLMKLGEPDMASQDETEVCYIASKSKAALVGGKSRDIPFIFDYIHFISFERNGLVKTMRLYNRGDDNLDPSHLDPLFRLGGYPIPEPHFSKSPIILPAQRE